MSVPNRLQTPSWVNSGAVITGGLDLLRLRLPVQSVGGTSEQIFLTWTILYCR
jgi:hypothetical protein